MGMPLKNNTVSVVVAAGGMGKRLGKDAPKAFIQLGGKALITYSLDVFSHHASVAEIVLVAPASAVRQAEQCITELQSSKTITLIEGGEHRWQSVKNGVCAIQKPFEWVLVHDAARPFVTNEIINSLLLKRFAYRCATTATPVTDTIRTFENDLCIETIDRSKLIRVGTPQLFHRETLLEGFTRAQTMSPPPTDEAMLMEQCGIPVGIAWGDPLNFKITTHSDLVMAEAILLSRQKK